MMFVISELSVRCSASNVPPVGANRTGSEEC